MPCPMGGGTDPLGQPQGDRAPPPPAGAAGPDWGKERQCPPRSPPGRLCAAFLCAGFFKPEGTVDRAPRPPGRQKSVGTAALGGWSGRGMHGRECLALWVFFCLFRRKPSR